MARDRFPFMPFYLSDFAHSEAVFGMTWDERGRYVWSWTETWPTDRPGVAHESTWRIWMRYTPKQWERHRKAISKAFTVHPDGTWVQERIREEAEKLRLKRTRLSVIGKAGNDRRWNGIA